MAEAAPDALALYAAETDGKRLFFRGNAVALDGTGLLILGGSGSGKSSLSLVLMAHGAQLISDDGIWVAPTPTGPALQRPPDAPPLIEARGVGLLNAGPIHTEATLDLVIDMDRAEPERLPPRRIVTFGSTAIQLILAKGLPLPGPILLHMLRHGRATP